MSDRSEQVYLAVDLGAESGRVLAGILSSGRIELTEVHRFSNGPVETATGLRWDFTGLYRQIVQGLKLSADRWGDRIVSIGVDTWGVDYGLIGKDGRLLEEPCHYRNSRTDGMQELAFRRVPRRDIYDITGIQFLPFNTIYQLLAEAQSDTNTYRDAHRLLMTPDLINYRLTGRMCNEVTIASTSQLLDARTRRWSAALMDQLNIRKDLFCDLVNPGEEIGRVTPDIVAQTGLSNGVRVIAVGAHDTASAVAGVPATGSSWAYLSSGTWSLLGVELQGPVINDLSYDYGFTNEAGVNKTTRLLKNIAGLWLLQECRRHWQREGADYSYAQLTRMAENANPGAGVIDPDEPSFATPGDMPRKINAHLRATEQAPSGDPGGITRMILESLALRYREVLDSLEKLTGNRVDTLHIVGGGSRNRLLNQLTANSTGRRVIAGPVEATATGNILIQMIAGGGISGLGAARSLISKTPGIEVYQPIE